MLTQSERRSGNRSRARLFSTVMGFALATASLVGCGNNPTAPEVMLHLQGTVTYHGAPLTGAIVHLMDRRSSYEPGYTLASVMTDANGRYEMHVQTGRPGYDAGCDHLVLFVVDFEYFTTASASIRCVTDPQTIDLTASDVFTAVSERKR